MRTIVLSALFAAAVGFAGSGAASAANMGAGVDNAARNLSPMVEKVAIVCRRIEVCHRGEFGRRVCHTERVCKHRW